MIDVNCTLCGKKLAEMTLTYTGELRIKCSRCKNIQVITQSVDEHQSND